VSFLVIFGVDFPLVVELTATGGQCHFRLCAWGNARPSRLWVLAGARERKAARQCLPLRCMTCLHLRHLICLHPHPDSAATHCSMLSSCSALGHTVHPNWAVYASVSHTRKILSSHQEANSHLACFHSIYSVIVPYS
jgi:hypothetical protein